MQLCYRGTIYQVTTNSVNTADAGITAKFLGNSYNIRQNNLSLTLKPNLYRYRGVSYLKSLST
jgi:Domain of unknown function (DUF4278)